MKIHHLALAILALLIFATLRAHAAFVFTLQETGGNVVVSGSGSLNLSALPLASMGATYTPSMDSYYGILQGGVVPAANGSADLYGGGGGITPTSGFGTFGYTMSATSGSGSVVGIDAADGYVIVPHNYGGGVLSCTDTYVGANFASLNITPGTYTYTWGSDSMTVTTVVPEPSTWSLLGVGAVSAGILTSRRDN